MKALLTLVLTIFCGSVFALPGDVTARESTSNVSCVPSDNSALEENLKRIGSAVSCGGFETEQLEEYCDCHNKLYGNDLYNSDSYKRFEELLKSFDSRQTAKFEFLNDKDIISKATLINLMAKNAGGPNPFQEGGACSKKFQAFEDELHGSSKVRTDNKDLLDILMQQKDFETLKAEEGIDESNIQEILTNFNQRSSHASNKLRRTIDDGMNINNLRVIDTDANGKISESLSPAVAIEGLCDSLVSELRAQLEEESFEYNKNLFVNNNALISEKMINSHDMSAFRGLRASFEENNPDFEDGQFDAYFGEKLCGQYVSDDDAKAHWEDFDNEKVLALSETELRKQFHDATLLLERLGTTAATIHGNIEIAKAHIKRKEQGLDGFLSGTNLKREDLMAALNAGGKDPADIVLEFLGSENVEKLGNNTKKVIEEAIGLKKAYDRVAAEEKNLSDTEEIYYTMQEYADELFLGAAHKKGGVEAARTFLGTEMLSSPVTSYYSYAEARRSDTMVGPSPLSVGTIIGIDPSTAYRDLLSRERNLISERSKGELISLFQDRGVIERDEVANGVRTRIITDDANRTREELISDGAATGSKTYTYRPSRDRRPDRDSDIDERIAIMRATGSLPSRDVLPERVAVASSTTASTAANDRFSEESMANEYYLGNQNPVATTAAANLATSDTSNVNAVNRNSAAAVENNSFVNEEVEAALSRVENLYRAAQKKAEVEGTPVDPALEAQLKELQAKFESLEAANQQLITDNEELKGIKEAEEAKATAAAETRVETKATARRNPFSGNTSGSTSQVAVAPTPVGGQNVGGGVQTAFNSRGVTQNNSDGPSLSSPSTYSTNMETPGGTKEVSINLTLVKGNAGFALVSEENATDNIKNVNVDFLNLGLDKKAEFIESFFQDTTEKTAFIRQNDGKVILIEKNEEIAQRAEGKQADIHHRLYTLNGLLNQIEI